MRKTAAFASGDHTGGSIVEIADTSLLGTNKLSRVKARVTGNTNDCTIGVYTEAADKASLTDAERAAAEVYLNDAVSAAADPDPELNVTGTPISFTLESGQSIYVYYKAAAAETTTTCSVELYID